MAATEYDFILTRNRLIYAALRKIGALYPGDSPRNEELTAAVDALQSMVDDWQNDHIFLWTQSPQTLTLVSGTASYALATDPRIFAVEKAFYRDADDYDTELEIITWDDYISIPDKSTGGRPSCIAIQHTNSPSAYVWPVPDSSGEIYYLGIAALKDFESADSLNDFTKRWQKALIYGLASELAPEYGIKVTEQRELERRAISAFISAKGGDRNRPTNIVLRGSYE